MELAGRSPSSCGEGGCRCRSMPICEHCGSAPITTPAIHPKPIRFFHTKPPDSAQVGPTGHPPSPSPQPYPGNRHRSARTIVLFPLKTSPQQKLENSLNQSKFQKMKRRIILAIMGQQTSSLENIIINTERAVCRQESRRTAIDTAATLTSGCLRWRGL